MAPRGAWELAGAASLLRDSSLRKVKSRTVGRALPGVSTRPLDAGPRLLVYRAGP